MYGSTCFAEHDHHVVPVVVRVALAGKRQRGERFGTVPYGYDLAEDGVHIAPNLKEPASAELIRSLYDNGMTRVADISLTHRKQAAKDKGSP
jgi:hypothetical protein